MSNGSIRAQHTAAKVEKQSTEFRSLPRPDIQKELGLTLEVAIAIERALRAETAETLEQFLTRALTVLLHRVEEGCMNVVPATDFLTPIHVLSEDHKIQIRSNLGHKAGDGKRIVVSMPSLPKAEVVSAHDCMRRFGFGPTQNSSVETEIHHSGDLDKGGVVSLACCLLGKLSKITAKNEIIVWFDHAVNEGKFEDRKINSAEELADCFRSIILCDPLRCECAIKSEHAERWSIFVSRLPCKKVRFSVDCSNFSPRRKLNVREIMKASGFVWRDSQGSGGDCPDWSGSENPELLAATVRQILHVDGVKIESSQLKAGFHWPPYFI